MSACSDADRGERWWWLFCRQGEIRTYAMEVVFLGEKVVSWLLLLNLVCPLVLRQAANRLRMKNQRLGRSEVIGGP